MLSPSLFSARSWLAAAAIAAAATLFAACGAAEPAETEPAEHQTPAPTPTPKPTPEVRPVAQKLMLTVKGMTCEHCEASIQREVKFCTGVKKITASHEESKVVVEGVGMDEDEVRGTIEKLGFTVLVGVALGEEPDKTPAKPAPPEKP